MIMKIKFMNGNIFAELDLLDMVEHPHYILQWILHFERLREVLRKLEEIVKVSSSFGRILVHQDIRKVEVDVKVTLVVLWRVEGVVGVV